MSNNPEVHIQLYQPGDDEGIVELLKKTFPKWNSFNDPLELWKWKYINTPHKSIIILATCENKIVGCYHSLIFNAVISSETTTIRYADDTAVDSDYRGLGIWNKMYAYIIELGYLEIHCYYTTINPILIKQEKKYDWRPFPFPVSRMIKIEDINQQLEIRPMKNQPIIKIGYTSLKTLNKITNIFKSPIKQSSEFQVTQIKEFDDRVDSFWDKIKEDYHFILEKKHDHLNWRFMDNDRGNHSMFLAVRGNDVLGYVVVGFKPDSSEGQIEELIALKERMDVIDGLFDSACAYLESIGVNTVYYQVVEGHPYQEHSTRKGFINSGSKPNILVTTIPGKEELIFLEGAQPSQVYFTYATTL